MAPPVFHQGPSSVYRSGTLHHLHHHHRRRRRRHRHRHRRHRRRQQRAQTPSANS